MPGKGGLFDLNQTRKRSRIGSAKSSKAEAARLPLSVKPERLARTSAGSRSMTTSEENQYERNVVSTGGRHRLCLCQKRNGISDGASGGSTEIPGYRNCYCGQ